MTPTHTLTLVMAESEQEKQERLLKLLEGTGMVELLRAQIAKANAREKTERLSYEKHR